MRLKTVFLLVIVLVPGIAAAQDLSKGNASFSYVVLRDKNFDETFTRGWLGAASGSVSRSWDVVGEIGQSSKSMTEPMTQFKATALLYNFVAGPRFVHRASSKVVPFGQVLVGGVRASGKINSCGSFFSPDECQQARSLASQSSKGFALQPGGGVDIALTRTLGVRVQGDYRYFRLEQENNNEFRFATGVVVRFGRF